MENFNGNNSNENQESSPLLSKKVLDEDLKEKPNVKKSKETTAVLSSSPVDGTGLVLAWTADGQPLLHRSVVGEPLRRSQWNSSLFACLGRNDEFCSSDIEVCLLGSLVPCVLYGTNAERIGSEPGTFANHCLPYSALYLIGNSFFGWNCLAPWFSYSTRTAIRRRFNLEGSFEALNVLDTNVSSTCLCVMSCCENKVEFYPTLSFKV